jgi:hypothetical protein
MAKQAQLVQTQNDYAVVSVADDTTTVYTGPCMLYGVYVNTVLSAQVLPIKDGATIVVTLPASAAAGSHFPIPGIKFSTSLIVDPDNAATGDIVVAYRPVNPDFVDGLTAITPAA